MKVSGTFTITLPNGKDLEIDATATKTVDPAYGADADGRRGERREYLEDILFDEKALVKAVREALVDVDWE